jgi:RNA polymerase sigma-70 factor (TIGR02943 family)
MTNPKEWVSSYGDYLYHIAMIRVNNTETARDLVQDTFLSAIKAIDSFKGTSSEKTWLTSILKNKIIDHYRKKSILKDTSQYLDQTEEGFYEHFFQADETSSNHWTSGSMPAIWKSEADQNLTDGEFYRVLEACIQKMPPKFIPVFTAKFMDEDDAEKICKDHQITPSNYWVIIHRAKLLMRSCIEKHWFNTRK